MARKEVRRKLIDSLKSELMGPKNETETINRVPIQGYFTGIIYPKIIEQEGPLDETDDRYDNTDEDEEIHTENHLPQSIGISLILATDELKPKGIEIKLSGALYEEEEKNKWKRIPISKNPPFLILNNNLLNIEFSNKKKTGKIQLKDIPLSIGEKLDGFEVVWETVPVLDENHNIEPNQSYLSVFIVNQRFSQKHKRAANSMYQVYLSVRTIGTRGFIAREQRHKWLDEDLQSLSLLYHTEHEFAVGHQVSVNWDPKNDSDPNIFKLKNRNRNKDNNYSFLPQDNIKGEGKNRCGMVETTFFPEQHKKALDFSIEGLSLSMYELSDESFFETGTSQKKRNITDLKGLADKYEQWINRIFSSSEKLRLKQHSKTLDNHQKNCKRSLSRIREGIKLLEDNEDIYKAFCFMNRAIWLNYINKKKSKKSKDTYVIDLNDKDGYWRPFQMGFILQALPSLVNPSHADRNIIDLLWVPTGGGKTEAYLGLIAFLLFFRRIRKETANDDGVEVIMRYTLRLLTLQQFQRAARLILACEYIRIIDQYQELKDCKPFSIGLYVGQGTTPNKISTGKSEGPYNDDYGLYEKLYRLDPRGYSKFEFCGHTAEYAIKYWEHNREHNQKEEENPAQILNCPWCGYELSHKEYEIDRNLGRMTIYCGNIKCPFAKKKGNPLRIMTVDESLINSPPSLLIGTVDKFAQLPFQKKIGSLFGWNDGKQSGASPSLIVQDELHLINGPLGSMVGLYEATIDYLSSSGLKVQGVNGISLDDIDPHEMKINWESRPKIIASTATIRNAKRQCRSLYDREALRFPPSGIHISDSFFVTEKAIEEEDKAYVGIFCAGIGMKSTIKKSVSSILTDVKNEKDKGRSLEDFDYYWTIVSYFNSRREQGGAVTLMRDDVRSNVESIRPSIRSEESIGELHGGLSSTELPIVLKRMDRRADETRPGPYDVLLCTNMFSVGIDIDRLGLMIMNCQPKATTEYLQSTGRVGRQGNGVIFVLYNQARPRDQSHFERFYDYHTRIQSHVEAMTVTPYSEGSLDRALHAQYIALLRHTFRYGHLDPISENTEAINYSLEHRNHSSSIMACLYLVQRAYRIDHSENIWKTVLVSLLEFQEEWLRMADAARKKPSVKFSNGSAKSELLYIQKGPWQNKWPRLLEQDPGSLWFDEGKRESFGYNLPPILTPNSLRNVEEEINLINLWRR